MRRTSVVGRRHSSRGSPNSAHAYPGAAARRHSCFERHQNVDRRLLVRRELDLDMVPAPIGEAARRIEPPFD